MRCPARWRGAAAGVDDKPRTCHDRAGGAGHPPACDDGRHRGPVEPAAPSRRRHGARSPPPRWRGGSNLGHRVRAAPHAGAARRNAGDGRRADLPARHAVAPVLRLPAPLQLRGARCLSRLLRGGPARRHVLVAGRLRRHLAGELGALLPHQSLALGRGRDPGDSRGLRHGPPHRGSGDRAGRGALHGARVRPRPRFALRHHRHHAGAALRCLRAVSPAVRRPALGPGRPDRGGRRRPGCGDQVQRRDPPRAAGAQPVALRRATAGPPRGCAGRRPRAGHGRRLHARVRGGRAFHLVRLRAVLERHGGPVDGPEHRLHAGQPDQRLVVPPHGLTATRARASAAGLRAGGLRHRGASGLASGPAAVVVPGGLLRGRGVARLAVRPLHVAHRYRSSAFPRP